MRFNSLTSETWTSSSLLSLNSEASRRTSAADAHKRHVEKLEGDHAALVEKLQREAQDHLDQVRQSHNAELEKMLHANLTNAEKTEKERSAQNETITELRVSCNKACVCTSSNDNIF